jgi:hypothetical protein
MKDVLKIKETPGNMSRQRFIATGKYFITRE